MTILAEISEDIQKIAIACVAAGTAIFMAVFKLKRSAAHDTKEADSDSATSLIINLLRAEVTRLSEQNSTLAKAVNALQIQVINLHQENIVLRQDVARIKNA